MGDGFWKELIVPILLLGCAVIAARQWDHHQGVIECDEYGLRTAKVVDNGYFTYGCIEEGRDGKWHPVNDWPPFVDDNIPAFGE